MSYQSTNSFSSDSSDNQSTLSNTSNYDNGYSSYNPYSSVNKSTILTSDDDYYNKKNQSYFPSGTGLENFSKKSKYATIGRPLKPYGGKMRTKRRNKRSNKRGKKGKKSRKVRKHRK